MDHRPGQITEAGFDAATHRSYEGLFTQGSGYLHVRGSLEEPLEGSPQNAEYTRLPANVTSERFRPAPSKWGTYVPGIFGRHPLLNNEMINLPYFWWTRVWIDGRPVDARAPELVRQERRLDLATGVLTREIVWRGGPHHTLATVRFERFISMPEPHLAMQRITIEAGGQIEIRIDCRIDADVRTNGYAHFKVPEVVAAEHELRCELETDAGDAVNIHSHIRARSPILAKDGEISTAARVEPDRPFVLERRTAVTTSRDLLRRTTGQVLSSVAKKDFERILGEHEAAWKERWRRSAIVIEGDDESQRAVDVSIHHLLRCHVPGDSRVAIDAKGYAGEAYWGRFFWDTEMYLLPFYLYTDPGRARTLVDFRVQSLEGARRNARRYGYAGARYAWESDAAGDECCPNWQYADHEVHVTADVAYGLAHYAAATGDAEYLRGPAAAVLVETARYWMERIDRRDGWAVLLGVMGPDEYTPISDNNAFTNRMVRFALEAAAEHGAAAGAGADEVAAWRRVARELPIPRAADGDLVLQCEGFERLAEPRFDEFWKDRERTFAAQVSQERLYRSKCLKQADVLMLMALFPHEFSEAEVRAAWDYYLPYTTHDSSLSAGVHCLIAARLGLDDQAWEFWKRGAFLDLDTDGGGAAEGIHIAAAGAVWQMIVFGFAGVRTAVQCGTAAEGGVGAPTVRPQLPDAWKRVSFGLDWRGTRYEFNITRTRADVRRKDVARS
ncbi:MAG: glycoside hydrolase family 65 protein [Phycisphaerales bacterium]|nr:glycoside hydrolase family 65 protein [Phycisphaerales bacterium]